MQPEPLTGNELPKLCSWLADGCIILDRPGQICQTDRQASSNLSDSLLPGALSESSDLRRFACLAITSPVLHDSGRLWPQSACGNAKA